MFVSEIIIMLTGNNIILDQFLNSHPLVMVPVSITLMVATTRSFITVCPLVIFDLSKFCHRFPCLAGRLRPPLHLRHSVLQYHPAVDVCFFEMMAPLLYRLIAIITV